MLMLIFNAICIPLSVQVVEPFGTYVGTEQRPGTMFVFYFGTARSQCLSVFLYPQFCGLAFAFRM